MRASARGLRSRHVAHADAGPDGHVALLAGSGVHADRLRDRRQDPLGDGHGVESVRLVLADDEELVARETCHDVRWPSDGEQPR